MTHSTTSHRQRQSVSEQSFYLYLHPHTHSLCVRRAPPREESAAETHRVLPMVWHLDHASLKLDLGFGRLSQRRTKRRRRSSHGLITHRDMAKVTTALLLFSPTSSALVLQPKVSIRRSSAPCMQSPQHPKDDLMDAISQYSDNLMFQASRSTVLSSVAGAAAGIMLSGMLSFGGGDNDLANMAATPQTPEPPATVTRTIRNGAYLATSHPTAPVATLVADEAASDEDTLPVREPRLRLPRLENIDIEASIDDFFLDLEEEVLKDLRPAIPVVGLLALVAATTSPSGMKQESLQGGLGDSTAALAGGATRLAQDLVGMVTPSLAPSASQQEQAMKAEWMAMLDDELMVAVNLVLENECIAGNDAACEAVGMEAWAKRAWLASLDSPLWDYFMGKVRVVLEEDCIKGDDVACDALSREEEAKREYFAQVDAPAQVAPAPVAPAPIAPAPTQSAASEEAAKRAWLEKQNIPTWGNSDAASREEEAKRAWLSRM